MRLSCGTALAGAGRLPRHAELCLAGICAEHLVYELRRSGDRDADVAGTVAAARMKIVDVPRSRADHALAVMMRAFCADPPTRWMFPDRQEYLTHFAQFVRLYAFGAFEEGSVHGIDGAAACSMWLAPESHSNDEEIIELLKRCIPEVRQSEVFDLIAEMNAYRLNEPHWFLPLIGVDPVRRGYGSALMAHMLARCDTERLRSYLDNTNEANLPFYERLGFRKLGVVRVSSCPPVYPMVRDPH